MRGGAQAICVLVASASLFSGGCHQRVSCTADLRSGLIITVRDAHTGEQAGDDARIVVRDGAFHDEKTLHWEDGPRSIGSFQNFNALPRSERDRILDSVLTFGTAQERAGRYEVSVLKPGYKDWTRTIRVARDKCHVIPRHVVARVARETSGAG